MECFLSSREIDFSKVAAPLVSVKFIRTNFGGFSELKLPEKLWNCWEVDLQLMDIQSQWKRIINIKSQILKIKLHSFYVRYVNRVVITNVKHHQISSPVSPLCSFCQLEDESWMHLFWVCPQVQRLWRGVITFCEHNISRDVDYSMSNCVLLGFSLPLLNFIMTYCKYFIHLARLFNTLLYVNLLLKHLKSVRF